VSKQRRIALIFVLCIIPDISFPLGTKKVPINNLVKVFAECWIICFALIIFRTNSNEWGKYANRTPFCYEKIPRKVEIELRTSSLIKIVIPRGVLLR